MDLVSNEDGFIDVEVEEEAGLVGGGGGGLGVEKAPGFEPEGVCQLLDVVLSTTKTNNDSLYSVVRAAYI